MTVIVDSPAHDVRRILLNRPAARNAIDTQTRLALLDALREAEADRAVRALLIGGAEGLFSAGGDLPSMIGLDRDAALARMRSGHEAVATLWSFPKPVVVAAERFAVGAAAGIALLADDVTASASTRFIFPFLKLGLIPDWGISGSLPLRVGAGVAARLLRDSATVTGEQAVALGIADRLVAEDAVMNEAIAIAETRARQPVEAFGRLKRLMRGDAETALNLRAEAEAQAACIVSAEFAEGYAAFLEKREPRFIR